MFKVNNKEVGTKSMMSLFLTLFITFSILVFLLTLNIFHILHDVKNAQYVLYTVSKFIRLQIEVFSFLNISPPL